jgi:hypothetical protein
MNLPNIKNDQYNVCIATNVSKFSLAGPNIRLVRLNEKNMKMLITTILYEKNYYVSMYLDKTVLSPDKKIKSTTINEICKTM